MLLIHRLQLPKLSLRLLWLHWVYCSESGWQLHAGSFFCCCVCLFVLPTYPTLLGAVQMDDTGRPVLVSMCSTMLSLFRVYWHCFLSASGISCGEYVLILDRRNFNLLATRQYVSTLIGSPLIFKYWGAHCYFVINILVQHYYTILIKKHDGRSLLFWMGGIKHSIYIDVFYIDKNIFDECVITECGVFLSIVNVVRPPVRRDIISWNITVYHLILDELMQVKENEFIKTYHY